MTRHLELDPQAENDLRGMDDATRRRIRRSLDEVAAGMREPGQSPYGPDPWRVLQLDQVLAICRPLTAAELKRVGARESEGYFIIRIVPPPSKS